MFLTDFKELLDKHQLECAPIPDFYYYTVCLKGSSSHDNHVLVGIGRVIKSSEEEMDDLLKQVRLMLLFL